MGYSNTTKLALRKDDGNESIVNWREHNNSNLDLIDTTVGNLVDAINNAKLLLGQLGYDQNGDPIVDAATARDTLDAAQSEDAAGSLYDAEQAIGVNAGNIATNAAAISSLQDSVSWSDSTAGVYAYRTGRVIVVMVNPGTAKNIPAVGSSLFLTTIPAEYRPTTTRVAACDANGRSVQIMIEPNGRVHIWNGGIEIGSYWLRGSISYIYGL